MTVYPAIDLRKGRCVRLIRGDVRDETVYSKEPVSMAKLWQLKGAKYLHVVDLDGALTGVPKNLKYVYQIAKAVKVPVRYFGHQRLVHGFSQQGH
jgi:phosphoribosylformimino-5-aminoimidazole carboxamide ribotide isomerase